MNEAQINTKLKRGWTFKEYWRGSMDDDFIASGVLTVRRREYAAAVRGREMFATVYYGEGKEILI